MQQVAEHLSDPLWVGDNERQHRGQLAAKRQTLVGSQPSKLAALRFDQLTKVNRYAVERDTLYLQFTEQGQIVDL